VANNSLKRILVILPIAVLVLLFWYKGFHQHLTLTSLQENREYLKQLVSMHYFRSVAIYIAICASVITCAIPGIPLLTLLGGFLFGFILGGFYSLIGASIGTSLSFLIIRHVLSNVIRGKYAQKLEKFNEKLRSQGVAYYLLTMHLVGLIPYFVITCLAALTDVPFVTFFWTTALGSIPIIFIYSFAGRQLYLIESMYDIFSPTIIVLLLVLIMVGLLPLLLRKKQIVDHDVEA